RATPVPNLLFTSLLPQISDRAELLVTLFAFYALQRKRGFPRALSAADLLAERSLVQALASDPAGPEAAVRRGLEAAARRGTLLALPAGEGDGGETLYVLNTEPVRRAVRRLAAAGRRPAHALEGTPDPAAAGPVPSIYALYEEHVGTISPIIAQELREAEESYPPEWIEAAFREAAALNKRSWRYVQRILERWETEGPDFEEAGRVSQGDEFERRYLSGKYGRIIRDRTGRR
ncbi:MAG TPA: DnaD domain protein, partial [Dehalococcoidia bacterium]